MSFAAPWMLLWLAVASVPILLHFRRRVQKEIAFPSVSIIKKVARKRKKRLRIRELVLLALRLLAVATIALAAARPGVTVKRPGGLRTGSPIALAIVLDDSMSMQLEVSEGKTVFEKAKALALDELNRLRPGDAAALIFSGRPIRQPTPEATFDIDRVRKNIQSSETTYFSGDIPRALLTAGHILQKSRLVQKEILLITDLSEKSTEDPWSIPKRESGIRLRVLDARESFDYGNAAIDQVLVSYSPEGVAREALIEARVSNFSDTPLENLMIVLEVENSEVSRGTIDVPARGSTVKQFYHRFQSEGVHPGSVRIRNDALRADDVRYFTTAVRESIRVLIVDGDYHPGSYRDEAFYLHRALETPSSGEALIKTIVVDLPTAEKTTLAANEVVFLAGVNDLPKRFGSRLIQYVEQGGGLFVTASSKGSGLGILETIMPASINSIRQASNPEKPFRIAAINRSHPVFEPFASGPTGLEQTEIQSHLLVKPAPGDIRNTLIELTRGFPLLMERQYGNGRIMFLATTIDRDWTDLPIRPGFLPLVQRATRHLAGRLDDRGPRRISSGDAINIEVSAGMQHLVVRGPDGEDTSYAAAELVDKSMIEFKATYKPGHYLVWAEIPEFGGLRELPTLGFVVETDPRESDLTQIIGPDTQKTSKQAELVSSSLPIWPHLLIAAILLLFAETWQSGQGLRRSHGRKKPSSSP